MEVTEHVRLHIDDASGVGEARRIAVALAETLGFDAQAAGRVGIVATEIATNLVRHAGSGELLVRALERGGARGLGFLALDRGPGLSNPAEALRDGFSSAGTAGNGLGAIRRLCAAFDLYSAPGAGVVLTATLWARPPGPDVSGIAVGGINVPVAGETVSGDAWAVHAAPKGLAVLVADGLGHGMAAADASAAATTAFRRHSGRPPAEVLERIHEALRGTRGAAVAVAEIDLERRLVRFAGVGNIAGMILGAADARSVVSHHGTAGHEVRRIQEFTYPLPADGTFILHSDGLVSSWTLDRHPGLRQRDPMLIAGLLYRDFSRGRDDTSVVVLRVSG